MTHPDPYIEEVMKEFDALILRHWHNPSGEFISPNSLVDGLTILFLTALETQKSATKTQRIKDIEENKGELMKEMQGVIAYGDGQIIIKNQLMRIVDTILTSRKAAIEEV